MPDTKDDQFFKISDVLCDNNQKKSPEECYLLHLSTNSPCNDYGKCRIWEKTLEQLQYVGYDLKKNSFLKACPGSGKTEVVGLKSAYEFKQWTKKTTGIAVLTYTNKATDVITDRVQQFAGSSGISHPHFIGTIDSWMHRFILNPFAHLVTKYSGKDDDRSIHLIDRSSDAEFLKNSKFSTKYSFFETGSIHANEFYFLDKDCDEIIFSSGDLPLDAKRKSSTINSTLKSELRDIKREFWNSGFVTHQDVDIICYKILNDNPEICKLISNRFAVVIIDECQDLSSIKIDIFRLLKSSGSIFHLVGDLHQSIFSYNNADFKKIIQFTEEENFTTIPLTKNFRSVQSIVNTCRKLVKNQEQIVGYDDVPGKNHCLIFSYRRETMHEIPKKFSDYLKINGYDAEKSAIIVRNNSNKNSLMGRTTQKIIFSKLAPTAIYLWSLNDTEYKKDSLNYFGVFLSKFLFPNEKRNYKNFYGPIDVPNYQWRLFLTNLLNRCNQSDSLADLTQTWTDWRDIFNKTFPAIFEDIQFQYGWLSSVKITEKNMIKTSPSGNKNSPVITTIDDIKHHIDKTVELSTIHSAKGKTFDSILFVSSFQSSGDRDAGSGYWQHWLDINNANGESARFAYVASSRPKSLLAWAISEKDYEDRSKIEHLKNYGFVPAGTLATEVEKLQNGQESLSKYF
nr:ATP-dependent helicase [uncultured Methanoregula sp.]